MFKKDNLLHILGYVRFIAYVLNKIWHNFQKELKIM